MNGLADVAIFLWFLPVLVNLLLPLAMLVGWASYRLLFRKKTESRLIEVQKASFDNAAACSQARA